MSEEELDQMRFQLNEIERELDHLKQAVAVLQSAPEAVRKNADAIVATLKDYDERWGVMEERIQRCENNVATFQSLVDGFRETLAKTMQRVYGTGPTA